MPSTDESPLTSLCIGDSEFQQYATHLSREGMVEQKRYSSLLKYQVIRKGLEPFLQACSNSVPSLTPEALPYELPQAAERAALARS